MNAPFPIERGIPVPPRITGGGRPAIYPFASMQVGDSFTVPDDMGRNAFHQSIRQNAVIGSARGYAKRHDPSAKFTVRLLKDTGEVGCWRVA